jgi:putative ABC transport system permease protein
VALLIALPVAAMVAGSTVLETVLPTPERRAEARMGQADLLASPSAPESTLEALRALLPVGSRIEPFGISSIRLVLPGREIEATGASVDLDGLGRGMFTLLQGRLPASADEVAISPRVAAFTSATIGGRITIKDIGAASVVGLVESPDNFRGPLVVQDAALASGEAKSPSWLVGLPAGFSIDDLDAALPLDEGHDGDLFYIASRRDEMRPSASSSGAVIVLGGLALVEAALVASAAFAVSIRRRQRELGLLAATGAEPRHLAGSVLAEGVVLGTLGALVGVAGGVGLAIAASPFLDALTGRRNPALAIAPGWVITAAAIGLVAALLACLVPAWTAARVPVTVALSGRRPATLPAGRTLSVGILLIGIAIASTGAGATMRLHGTNGGSGTISVILLLAGAILGVLGFGAASPWLLERLERPAAHLPLASRIALRDTARARSRNGPIVTAILASFAATVAVAAYSSSNDAANAARWQPWARPDQMLVEGPGAAQRGPEAARQLGAIAAGPILGLTEASGGWVVFRGGPSVLGADGTVAPKTFYSITAGDDELLRAMGAEAAKADLAAGKVVLLASKPAEIATVKVLSDDGTGERTIGELPARVLVTSLEEGMLPTAIVSPATADRIGLVNGTSERYLLRLDHPVTDDDLARAAAIVADDPECSRPPSEPQPPGCSTPGSGTWVDASRPPGHPDAAFRLFALIASLVLALSVTGIAVVLGEAESRSEQRTLLAIGADPRLRRRIAAARAGVLAVLAGILAVPAGLLPIWGLLLSRGSPLVVPIPEVLAALVVLPAIAILGTLIVARPIPSWSAFRGPTG